MTEDLTSRAQAIADSLPVEERLRVLTRFGFMRMTAGDVGATRAVADEIAEGLKEAEGRGLSLPQAVTELEALRSWVRSASQGVPDARQDGSDLANAILADPEIVPRLLDSIRSGKMPNLGSRAVGDAIEELCRRGEPRLALALLDQISGSEAGHRARLRAGLQLKREPVDGIDADALITAAIEDARRMDKAEGKSAKRQFLAGIALMSFDDVEVARRIMEQIQEEGHQDVSAGIKQRLARGLLAANRPAEARELLASIRSKAARELAVAALLDDVAAVSGTAAARALVEGFTTPAAAGSVRAKLAMLAARDEPALANAELAAALGVIASLRESDPFFYTALADTLSAYAAVSDPRADADAAVIALLGPRSAFPDYRLRLAEHLGGALAGQGRIARVLALAERLDGEAASVLLMRASLP
jgi:hypothetical protein